MISFIINFYFQLLFFVGYFGVLKNLADEEKKSISKSSKVLQIPLNVLEFAFGNLKLTKRYVIAKLKK